jgi:hypothetical protein
MSTNTPSRLPAPRQRSRPTWAPHTATTKFVSNLSTRSLGGGGCKTRANASRQR